MAKVLYSVGHSTRSAEEIVELLGAHGIEEIADVRAYPGSRRHPHVHTDEMARWLGEAGIAYRHIPSLGGRRRPRPDSENDGWENKQFQAYADHMATDEFAAGLSELLEAAAQRPTACLCSEAQWWRCHRRMVCDAALVAGYEARHIMSKTKAVAHELTAFAVVRDGALTYPPAQERLKPGGS